MRSICIRRKSLAIAVTIALAFSSQLINIATAQRVPLTGKEESVVPTTQQFQGSDEAFKSFLKKSTDEIWFEVNHGQYPAEVLYGFKTSFGAMAVYQNKLRLFAFQVPDTNEGTLVEKALGIRGVHSVDISFPGSENNWTISPSHRSPTIGSYVITTGHSVSPDLYGEITLNNVYPGIDLRLYAAEGHALEFDWIVKKASDYEKIRMSMQGQDGLTILNDGSVVLDLRYQDLNFFIPQSYQVLNGKKQMVTAYAALAENNETIKYTISGTIDENVPLVIDPTFSWSTFFDANSSGFDEYAFAVCANLNGVYVTGRTDVLPPVSYMNGVAAGYSNLLGTGFITYRLNLSGTAITAWTMANSALGAGVKVGDNDLFPDGRLAIIYSSGDFEIFNANLSSELFFGATVAGVNLGTGSAVVIESDSVFYLGGNVTTPVIGVTIGPDATQSGTEGFICRFNIKGNIITAAWGTYIGGAGTEGLMFLSLTPDKTKLVFGTQTTTATGIPPLVNPVDSTFAGTMEALVGVLPNQATVPSGFLVLSWLGGSLIDGTPLVTSTNNYFYVGFQTSSTDLPATAGAFQTTFGGDYDLAVARIPLNGSLGSGFRCSYLGGTDEAQIAGIVYNDRTDEIALFGSSRTGSLPTVNTSPPSAVYQTVNAGGRDMIYAVVSPDLASKKYATFIGGSSNDYFGSTGTIRGQGTFTFSSMTGQIYAATTTHSVATGVGSLPAAFFSGLPGFDKTKSNGGSDSHLIFAVNTSGADYGDAPAGYENGDPANEAVDPSTIYIGLTIDAESAGQNSAPANGDDLLNSGSPDDEDGIKPSEPLHMDASSITYSLTVSVFNNGTSATNLWGWIDFNLNGLFDAAEGTSVSVPKSNLQQNVVLNWSGIAATAGQSYLRLRLSSVVLTDSSATGTGGTGEVEDYPFTICGPLTVTISGPSSFCSGDTITLDAGAGYSSYLWSLNNDSTQTIEVTKGGTYSVTVSDTNGCTGTATKTVVANDPTFSRDSVTACGSFSWNDSTYTQSTTDARHFTNVSGCDSTATLVLAISDTATSSESQTACDSFLWNGTVYTTGGDKTHLFQGQNGCDSLATLHLTINTAPPANCTNTGILTCLNASAIVNVNNCDNAPDRSYSWSGPGGFTSTDQCPTVFRTGTYKVIVTNTAGAGCKDSCTTTVDTCISPPVLTCPKDETITTSIDNNAACVDYGGGGKATTGKINNTPKKSPVGIDFRQPRNENHPAQPLNFTNGINNQTHAEYFEGMGNPQRVIFTDIVATPQDKHTFRFRHEAVKHQAGDVHAYDFMMSWEQAVKTAAAIGNGSRNELENLMAQACNDGISATALASCDSFIASERTPLPDDMGNPPNHHGIANVNDNIRCFEKIYGDRDIEIRGKTEISDFKIVFEGYDGKPTGDNYAWYTISWTSASPDIMILFAGRAAMGAGTCGYGNCFGAASIHGGPYHFKLELLDGYSLGERDNQLMVNKSCDMNIPVTFGTPTVQDACYPNTPIVAVHPDNDSYDSLGNRIVCRTWNVADPCGRTASCSQCITISCIDGKRMGDPDELPGNVTNGNVSVNVFPNPFTDKVTLAFMLNYASSHATVEIYDMAGAKVATLFDGTAIASNVYTVEFSGGKHARGVYFARIATDADLYIEKLVLIR